MHPARNSLTSYALAIVFGFAVLQPGLVGQEKAENWKALLNRAQASFNSLKSEETIALLGRVLEILPQGKDRMEAQIKVYELRGAAYELARKPELALQDAQAVLGFIKKRDEGKGNQGWIRPMLRAAKLMDQTRQREPASSMYRDALELSEGAQENRLTLSLEIFHLCARGYGRIGDWQSASKTLITYIERLEEKHGKNHADLVGPLKNLARYQRNAKAFEEAIKSLNRWVKIYELSKGKDSPSTATGLRAIAECHIALQSYAAAEKALDRWQMVLERVTKKHPEIVYVLQLRAQIDRLQKKYLDESGHIVESAKRMAALPKPDYTALGEFNRLLAVSYRQQAKYDLAKIAIDECMAFFKKKLRATDPQRLMGQLERGHVSFAIGAMDAAKKDYDAVLRSWRKLAGDEHRILIAPLEALLTLAQKTKDETRAQELSLWIKKIEAKTK